MRQQDKEEVITRHFLKQNGYKLPVRTDDESRELIELEVGISPLKLFEDQYDYAVKDRRFSVKRT